jgi:2-(3-amino-3-carboxypropyl)histidine synthase
MNVKYIEARFNGEIKLSNEVIQHLKRYRVKQLALFASVQFLNLDGVKEQLAKEEIQVLSTRAKRCSEDIQILGCDCYADCYADNLFDSDAILYIGDGTFHPNALLFAQLENQIIKPVVVYNPVSNKMSVVELSDIEAKSTKMKVNIKKFIASDKIGIFVSSKSGQQFYNLALELKEKLISQGKKAFIFVGDNFYFGEFENFNFIESWVNCACPRIATDDVLGIKQPVVNIKDALEPIKALDRL